MCPTSGTARGRWTSTHRRYSWEGRIQSSFTIRVKIPYWLRPLSWTWSSSLSSALGSSSRQRARYLEVIHELQHLTTGMVSRILLLPRDMINTWTWILQGKFHSFHPVATILSYLTKAPLVSLLILSFRVNSLTECSIQYISSIMDPVTVACSFRFYTQVILTS